MSGKGFPFPIPIKIKMTSSDEAERWNEFFNQLRALIPLKIGELGMKTKHIYISV